MVPSGILPTITLEAIMHLNIANFAVTTLNGAVLAGATSLIFTTTNGLPDVPFKFAIDQEIFTASAKNGSTYTVQGGQEGTIAAPHASGAGVTVSVTRDMFLAAYPQGSQFSTPGTLQIGTYDFISDVTASAAGTISLPSPAIPYRDYTITDAGGNFATFNQTLAPLGVVMNLNGQSVTVHADENGTWHLSTPTFNSKQRLSGIVAANSSLVVPAGRYISTLLIQETAGHPITGGLKIGTSAGGNDVVAAIPVAANSLFAVEDMALLKRLFSLTNAQALYIDAISAWNSASLNVSMTTAPW